MPREIGPLRADPHPGLLRGTLHALYDASWLLGILCASPWLLWRGRAPGFRRMVGERLTRGLPALPAPAGARILVHGVSVGEIKAAQPLVDALAARLPGVEVVVSAATDTGLAVAREVFRDHVVVRFPADLSHCVQRFLRRLAPTCVVLIELEIWPNFLREANRLGIPVAVVNGRITPRSFRSYRVFRHFLPQFDRITLFCAQGEEYAQRFRELCANSARVLVTGNIKGDRLPAGAVDPGPELTRLLGGAPGQRVLVAGSTHAPEERWVIEAWRAGDPAARLVLVPRHPARADELARELAESLTPVQRLSVLRSGAERPDPSRPALVDTIGELERVYGLADVVFVGGSLVPHGGQNLLEPAAQGRPLLFGPHVENFTEEARLLLEAGACRQVSDAADLGRALRALAGDAEARAAMGRAGRAAAERQRGATELTLRALRERCLS